MPSSHIKDASFLQQHIEKLILAAGVLVLAVAVFLFVIGNPFAIEVNRQTYETPAEAVDVLVRIDDQLESGLEDLKPLPAVDTPDFSASFLEKMERPVELERRVASVNHGGIPPRSLYPTPPEKSRYALVFPPVPKNVTHQFGTDVLDKEFDLNVTSQLFEMWGKAAEEPGDFSMFIAAGEFDIWQWIERLKADPAVEGEIKIPAGIWAQRFGIAGVALLREEWDQDKGQWGEAVIVEPLPNQTRILPDDKAEAETSLAIAQLTLIRDNQVELAQPELPWLTDFVQVAPPGEEGNEEADVLLQALNDKNLGKAEKEIIKLEEKIKQLEERRAKRRPREGAASSPRGVDEGFGDTGERRDPIARQIQSLRERIAKLEPQALIEAENRKRMEEARRLREEERRRRSALRDERDRAFAGPNSEDPLGLGGVEGTQLEEGATLRVWAADPSMRPGKTYRYKLLVSVINPLYAVPRLAPDQLEANQHRAAILPTQAEIDSMPWIGPIKVEPKSQFLFTAGREGGARIEIYRRHKGEIRMQEFDGAPGDSIGSILKIEDEVGDIEEIQMGVGAVLVDVEKRRDLFTNRTVYAMIYMDAKGNIFERIDDLDKSSPIRRELQEELKEGPKQVLRPAPDATPVDEFGPGEFSPGLEGF